MIRRICLPAVALTLFAAPAFAQDNCAAPGKGPAVPSGRTAQASELSAAAKEVVAFMKASDEYQTCLLNYINVQTETAAKEKKTFDPKIKAALQKKGDDNQKEKERVGVAYNT